MLQSLAKLVRSLLPGIFLFGFCIGTGSVTAMAKAGADYGMALLWTVLLSCLITYYLIVCYGELALVTGETALLSFRRHVHPLAGWFFVVTLTAHVSGSVMGVMGILADVCHVWSQGVVEGGVPRLAVAVVFVGGVYALFLDGRMRVFERVLAVVAAVMVACFLLSLFVTAPPPAEMVRGLLPGIPEAGDRTSAFLVVASMVGTTVFSGLFILRGSLVQEAGWTLDDLGLQRRDAAFSAGMMFVTSASVMAAAAGTLHASGLRLESTSQMVSLLEPLAGPFATAIFVTGIVAAGLSSQFPNVTLLPCLLDDYYERERSLRRADYRVAVLLISLLGLVVPVLGARPVSVMIVSQAFGALVLPATVAGLLYLGNRRDLMGEHRFGRVRNALLAATLLFAVLMSSLSYRGLLAAVEGLR